MPNQPEKGSGRRLYRMPCLQILGDVRELTEGGSTGMMEKGGGEANKKS